MREEAQRALKPFVKRLWRETLLRAARAGWIFALTAFGALALNGRLARGGIPWGLCLAGSGGAFCLAALAGCLLGFPTLKKAAVRADSMGLMNRAATMAALKEDESCLAKAQRRDTVAHLAALNPKELPLRIPRRGWAALAGAAIWALLAVALPESLLQPQAEVSAQAEETEEARVARELLEALRQRILDAELSEEERQRLLDELEKAEAGMGEGPVTLDALAEVMQASGRLEEALEEEGAYQPWIYALLGKEKLAALAQAYIDKNDLRLQAALAVMKRGVTAPRDTAQIIALMDIKTAITEALEESPPDDNDAYLAYILADFANDMEGAAQYVASKADPAGVIDRAFTRAERQLLALMHSGMLLSEAEEDEDTAYIRRPQESDSQEDTGAQGQAGDGGQDAGLFLYSSNPDTMQGAGTGTRAQQHFQETEKIYEPSLDPYSVFYSPGWEYDYETRGVEIEDGHVAYGAVYGIYYARLLEDLTDGTVPPEALGPVEAYFYGL